MPTYYLAPSSTGDTVRYKLWLDARPDNPLYYLTTPGGTTAFNLRNRGSWVRIPLGAHPAHPQYFIISRTGLETTLPPPAEETSPPLPTEEITLPSPAKEINWPALWGVIGGVVAVGLLIFFLVRRETY